LIGLDASEAERPEFFECFGGKSLPRGADYPRFFRALGDFKEAPGAADETLREMFSDPSGFDAWAADYRARLSGERSADAARKASMDSVNPEYVLRNYLAQNAIARAEGGDYSEIQKLLELLRDPFAEQPGVEEYAAPPPAWGRRLVLSCSSWPPAPSLAPEPGRNPRRARRLTLSLKIASSKKYLTTQSALSYIHCTRPALCRAAVEAERLR